MKKFNFAISIFLIFIINQCLICICHPIFSFDFFGTSQSTTTESVISDYRTQKKADSSFDHINLMKNGTEDEPVYTESNADFYAEIFGKLVGSVRSSFADLIGDIKKRNQYFRDRNDVKEKIQKSQQNKTIEEINLEAIMRHLEAQLNETSLNSTVIDESEVMSRKSKRNPFIDVDNVKVGQLTIPINLNPFDNDLISEEDSYESAINDNANINAENGFNTDTVNKDDSHWLRKYYEFFEQIKENHHNRKERKIMNLLKLILTPVLQLNKTTTTAETEENFDNEVMFNIIQGNRTIAQLTPFQILRILHKESNDRIQLRMKLILKRIVYKYARLYYIARKNFKKSHGHHYQVEGHDDSENFRLLDDSLSENDIADNDFDFSTNDGRHNFQSLEGITILFLEIFGALFALSIGFWAQLEGGFFYDLLE